MIEGTITRFSKEVRIDQLASRLGRVYEALLARGISPEQGKAFIANELRAECVQCGMTVNGEELAEIATSNENAINQSPKLTRIVQSYCARKDCGSYVYKVFSQENGSVKWDELWESPAESGANDSPSADEGPRPSSSFVRALIRRHGLGKVLFALAALIIGLLLLYLRFKTPSWSSEPSKYQADPASVRPANPEEP